MNNSRLKDELLRLTMLIQQQQQHILSGQGAIPKIELDILLQNYRKAYELFIELGNSEPVFAPPVVVPDHNTALPDPDLLALAENTSPVVSEKAAPVIQEAPVISREPEPAPVAVQHAEEEIKPLQKAAEQVPVTTAPISEEINPVQKTPEPVPALQPEIITASVETPVFSSQQEEISEAVLPQAGLQKERTREFAKATAKTMTASLFDESPTVAQQFREAATVRDRYTTANDDSSVAEKLQQHPLSDLKKSIGINEKFSFVNELFDGDLGQYNTAIDQLNNCTDLNSAMEILSSKLAPQYQWTEEGSSYRQLKSLVSRRFSA